jgi:hypothetical protein
MIIDRKWLSFSLPRQRIWIFRAVAFSRFGDSKAFGEGMYDRTL